MNKNEAQLIQDKMLEILAREMPEYDFTTKGGSFSDLEFTPKLAISKKEAPEVKFAKQKAAMGYIDFNVDYGQLITYHGAEYKIIGFDPSRRKYTVLVENVLTGKHQLFDPLAITLLLQDVVA